MRHWIAQLVLAWTIAVCLPASYAAAKDDINVDESGVAISGYDPVAYFTENQAIRGDPQYQYKWQDATWHFSSPEHRDLFSEAPEKYAPRYGGFCSGAMTAGFKVVADPEAWRIIDGKLYLAVDKQGIEHFAADAAENIPRADRNWQEMNDSD